MQSFFFVLLVFLNGQGLIKCKKIRHRRSATECSSEIIEEEASFRVFLTVNAKASYSWQGSLVERKLELNWTPPPDQIQPGDWVGLFKRRPNAPAAILARVNATVGQGYFKTEVSFPRNSLMGMKTLRTTCLYGFMIAYIREDRTLKLNCMRLRPNWMFEDRHLIGDIPLHDLMIPGTHNSGMYDLNFERSDSLNIVNKFSVNQDEDVWNQLLFGIRFLDLRIGYYENTPEKFWIVHDFIKRTPFSEVINDVQRFMRATNEIVIMDFHRFPTGFDDKNGPSQVHADLQRYVRNELGDFMAPDVLGLNVTPNELWGLNKTLLVTYAHGSTTEASNVFWPEVKHVWGNQRTTEGLRAFLSESMSLHKWARFPWAAMSHLTPTHLDVFLNINEGLRELSDAIARNLTMWYRDDWWNTANIVATDFFLGNNVIEESIIANKRRKQCKRMSRSLW